MTTAITSQDEIQEALRQSEERFRAIVNQATAGITQRELDGTLTFVNRKFCAITGYSEAELLGMTMHELTHPDDIDRNRFLFEQMLKDGLPFEIEKRYLRKNGSLVWVSNSTSLLHDAEGNPQSILTVVVDITERKRAEQALQESELKLRYLFDNAREAIGVATNGKIIFVNPAYARLLGYPSPDEMVGISVFEAVAPRDRERLLQIAARRLAGEQVPFSYEFRGRKRDGTECDLENHVSNYELDGQLYTVVTTRDITVRKKEERASQFLSQASAVLASSLDYEHTLQQVADLAVPHIADWCGVDMLEEDNSINQLAVAHVDPKKVKWGHELRKRYPPDPHASGGLPNVLRTGQAEIYSHIPDELLVAGARDAEHLEMMRQIGLDSLMIVPMVARERILGAITFVATNESGHHYTDEDLTLAEGLASRAAIAIDNARLYRAAQNELAERRRVQTALYASEERFRFALANSSILVYTQDRDLRYTWVYNGASNGEDSHVYGKTDADILDPEDAVPLTAIKRRVLETRVEERHIIRATPLGQEPLYLDTSFAPLWDAEANVIGITGTANDITERKKVQDALVQHQSEIEALNLRLRRSMTETHHRVKNNLQVISAMIEMQAMDYQDAQAVPLEDFIQLKAHIHTLSIVHDLLTQSVKENEDAQRVSAKTVLERLLPMLQQTAWKQHVTYTIDNAALTSQQCVALSLVLNELVSNALKHGENEATITFRTEETFAILTVSDDGAGFPEDFDALQSANTGLELVVSLVRSDLHGGLRFTNRPQGGGQVVVTFALPQETE